MKCAPHFARAAAFRAAGQAARLFLAVGMEAGIEAFRSPPSEQERAEIDEALDDRSLVGQVFERAIAEDLAVTAGCWQAFDELCREELSLDGAT